MIQRLLSYPYGGVRSRALTTRLLSPVELTALTTISREQAAGQLEHRLSPGAGPEPIETRLQEDYLAFAQLILPALPAPAAQLLRNYLRRNWVDNLIALSRNLRRGRPLVNLPPPLPTLDAPPLPKPDELDTLRALAAALPKGRYRERLQSQDSETGVAGQAALENGLLRIYWDAVTESAHRLPGPDRAAAREILGERAEIDAVRILWRGVRSGLRSTTVLAALPPLGRRLDPGRLRRALRSENPEEALRQLLQLRLPDGAADPAIGEQLLRRQLRQQLRRWLISAPVDIAVPLSALLLKELETADLAGLLGGLRYGLTPEQIAGALAGGKG